MNKRRAWTNQNRGQSSAGSTFENLLQVQPQAGETITQLSDQLIEDSPYQVRKELQVEESLVQAMRSAGFQGVLLGRLHPDVAKRQQGIVQLAYGHRRRIAWRMVCAERDAPCDLPMLIRDLSDEDMLRIGAQENVQREDLHPLEEADIVQLYQRMFPQLSSAEIGQQLGKTEDWVKVRSRVAQLPAELKQHLVQRPDATSHMLDLVPLFQSNRAQALTLANQVVTEQLPLKRLRQLVQAALAPAQPKARSQQPAHQQPLQLPASHSAQASPGIREENHEWRDVAPFVKNITNSATPIVDRICQLLQHSRHDLDQVELLPEEYSRLVAEIERFLIYLDQRTRQG